MARRVSGWMFGSRDAQSRDEISRTGQRHFVKRRDRQPSIQLAISAARIEIVLKADKCSPPAREMRSRSRVCDFSALTQQPPRVCHRRRKQGQPKSALGLADCHPRQRSKYYKMDDLATARPSLHYHLPYPTPVHLIPSLLNHDRHHPRLNPGTRP